MSSAENRNQDNKNKNLNTTKLTMKQHRLLRGYTQEAMAQHLQISKSTYAKIEKGILTDNLYIFAFAGALELSVDNIQLCE